MKIYMSVPLLFPQSSINHKVPAFLSNGILSWANDSMQAQGAWLCQCKAWFFNQWKEFDKKCNKNTFLIIFWGVKYHKLEAWKRGTIAPMSISDAISWLPGNEVYSIKRSCKTLNRSLINVIYRDEQKRHRGPLQVTGKWPSYNL